MRLTYLLVVVALVLPGCLGGGPSDDKEPDAQDATVDAPWWALGESWTVRFNAAGKPARTTTLVNFANNTFNDPAHFWLGVKDRSEAMDHVFFDTNPFLGRIHWQILAPHEKGMHSAMYSWPIEDGSRWDTGLLFGTKDVKVVAKKEADGTFDIKGDNGNGGVLEYDYDPATHWFRSLKITEDGATRLSATVTDHKDSGARGTYYFLRGRDYLDSTGGTTGTTQPFNVKDEGATSIAFLLNVQASAGSRIEFLAPDGSVFHSENLLQGGTSDKIVEVTKTPPPGDWSLRYIGTVSGMVKVRGVIEYKATL